MLFMILMSAYLCRCESSLLSTILRHTHPQFLGFPQFQVSNLTGIKNPLINNLVFLNLMRLQDQVSFAPLLSILSTKTGGVALLSHLKCQ